MVNDNIQSRNTRGNNNTAEDESINIYANEIVRSLFGNGTGNVKGDFPCYNGRISGRLYIASNAICYYSYFLGFEQKNIILLAEVKHVDKIKRNTIQIITNKDEEYLYRGFNNREIVWAMLDELLKNQSSQRSNKLTTGNQKQSKKNILSSNNKLGDPSVNRLSSAKNVVNNEEASTPSLEEISGIQNRSSSSPRLQNQGLTRVSSMSSDEPPRKNSQDGKINDSIELLSSPFSAGEKELSKKPTNLKSAWARLKAAYVLQDCLEQKVHQHFLNCSIEEYFDNFLANDAKYSMETFQKEKYGDNNFVTTKWKDVNHEDGKEMVSMERILTYAHPNKANMGPVMIHVTQEQKLCRYGQHGIWLWKGVFIQGVPAADCFHVEEEILIEPKGEGTNMMVQFNIVFKKKTMLRSIIEASTKTQSKQGLLDSVQYMKNALNGNLENIDGNYLQLELQMEEMKRTQIDLQQRLYHVFITVVIIFVCLFLLATPDGKISALKKEVVEQEMIWKSKISLLETKVLSLQRQLDMQSKLFSDRLDNITEHSNESL